VDWKSHEMNGRPMNEVIERAARAAGKRLATEYGDSVPTEVQRALNARDGEPPSQYVDPIALGTLIVSAATLAWTIYRDLKVRTPQQPSRDVVARALRVKLRDPARPELLQRDRVIEVVVDETVRAAAEVDE
jgi:hypothetical protein